MSSIQEYIEQNQQESKRLIGLEYQQLQQLIAAAELLHQQKTNEIEKRKVRIIKRGGGRKAKLLINDQIILTLVYLHHLPTFQMLGVQFGVSESTANDIFHYWSELLRELLPASLLEQVKKNPNEHEWVQEILGELELIVDSCEQPIQRPGGYQEQKKLYSGKKKNHTFKNQLIVTRLVKIFRIAQERFRLKGESYQRIILTVCGLVRLRIGALFITNFT